MLDTKINQYKTEKVTLNGKVFRVTADALVLITRIKSCDNIFAEDIIPAVEYVTRDIDEFPEFLATIQSIFDVSRVLGLRVLEWDGDVVVTIGEIKSFTSYVIVQAREKERGE